MKKSILIILVTLLLLVPFKIEAKTVGDLKRELAALESKYEENKNKRNLTDTEIEKLKVEINNTTASINAIKADMKKTTDEINDSQKEIDNKKDETDELLKFLQISSGENVYLEYVFESESYTDLIYRYSVASQLTEHNNELMEELTALIATLEKKEKELADKQKELEKKGIDLNVKVDTLRANLASYKVEGTTIEDDIKAMKTEIKRLANKGCKDNENILTCGNNAGGIINATGWNYPLKSGCVTSEYTGNNERTDWSGGGQHHGIDLGCNNEGTTVYAAANGVVAKIVERYWCGGNMVYVHHSVNGVPYTTVYMHLLRISVSKDQVVTPSTKIGEVGGGTTWYDSCSTGAHLHFGLAYGHSAYNFNANSFNPRNILSFPGYFRR